MTLIRESFSIWLPAYFLDQGSEISVSVLKSTVFPLLGGVGTLIAGYVSDLPMNTRFNGGRYPVILVSLFGLLGALLVLSTFALDGLLLVVIVGAVGFFLFAPYSMVGGGVLALDYGGKHRASTAAGLLDSSGYLGSSVAGVGVAAMVMGFGWKFAFSVLAGISGIAFLLAAILWRFHRRGAI